MDDGIKIVTVGDGAVGKTALMIRYRQDKWQDAYLPTIFENFTENKTMNINGKECEISLDLWDTAGQDQYDRLRILAYPNTKIVLLCFSCVNLDSLLNIETKWFPEIEHHIPSALLLLVGTKSDLKLKTDLLKEQGKEAVSMEKINELKKKINAVGYVECSAMDNININLVFETAIKKFLGVDIDDNDKKKGNNNGNNNNGGNGGCVKSFFIIL